MPPRIKDADMADDSECAMFLQVQFVNALRGRRSV
jgi:hypothetical protein